MQRAVLILGGYGNFGKRIASALVKADVSIIVAGLDHVKAEAFVRSLPGSFAAAASFDAALIAATSVSMSNCGGT